eukprot:TRINITY_DN5883_c0_g2_i3.p1 TRINITY_DN5883_c0_g2~~TRINITY_DN5883_c0_g2_i3.p1  ORF type:complete len:210 (+),score=48.89 TRINITY_DN5883_c0_g2_i3:71-700(+)
MQRHCVALESTLLKLDFFTLQYLFQFLDPHDVFVCLSRVHSALYRVTQSGHCIACLTTRVHKFRCLLDDGLLQGLRHLSLRDVQLAESIRWPPSLSSLVLSLYRHFHHLTLPSSLTSCVLDGFAFCVEEWPAKLNYLCLTNNTASDAPLSLSPLPPFPASLTSLTITRQPSATLSTLPALPPCLNTLDLSLNDLSHPLPCLVPLPCTLR